MRAQDFITKHTEQGVAEGLFSPQEYGKQLQAKINQDAINNAIVLKKQKQNLGNKIIANTLKQQLVKKGVAEVFQLDEGLGDWIEQKMDQLLNPNNNHNYSNRPDAVASAVKAAPVNLPDDVAERLVAEFLKRKDHEAALERAARAQGTTVDKIKPYLNYFVGNFIDRWRRIPARDKQRFWKDLALSVFRLIVFILQAMAKGKR